MLDRANEQHWQAVNESYPDAIVFHEADGFYIVRGPDLDLLAKEFRVGSSNRWCGFDAGQAWCYMSELAQRGYQVVRASNGSVAQVEPPADRAKELQRHGHNRGRRVGRSCILDGRRRLGWQGT
jgi:hypothetical protein